MFANRKLFKREGIDRIDGLERSMLEALRTSGALLGDLDSSQTHPTKNLHSILRAIVSSTLMYPETGKKVSISSLRLYFHS